MISETAKQDRDALFLSSYAQLFLMKNGNLESLENYLLVEQGKVADLRVNMALEKGDTLSVFVGHHINSLEYFGSSGEQIRAYGFHLEQVRLCIF